MTVNFQSSQRFQKYISTFTIVYLIVSNLLRKGRKPFRGSQKTMINEMIMTHSSIFLLVEQLHHLRGLQEFPEDVEEELLCHRAIEAS